MRDKYEKAETVTVKRFGEIDGLKLIALNEKCYHLSILPSSVAFNKN